MVFEDFELLARHDLLRSCDYDEIKEQVGRYICPHQLEVLGADPVETRLNGIFFGPFALFDLSYDAPVVIRVSDLEDCYLVRVTLQGSCEVALGSKRTMMQPGKVSVSSPTAISQIVTDGKCRNLILRIDRTALEVFLQERLNRSLRDPVVFDVDVDHLQAGVTALYHTFNYICRLFSVNTSANGLVEGLTGYLMNLLLTQLPHTYSEAIAVANIPLPYHLKLACSYIRDHLDEPLALSTLCALSGVSNRTLQTSFKHFMQTTPLAYIRDMRLNAVHAQLLISGSPTTVTNVLQRYGINSPSLFIKAYRRRFGCVPSQTLRSRPD